MSKFMQVKEEEVDYGGAESAQGVPTALPSTGAASASAAKVIYAYSPSQFKLQCATTEQAKLHEERGGTAERVPYSKKPKGVPCGSLA